jgi:hypothetical protein
LVRFVVGLQQLVRERRATVAFTLDPLTCPPLLVSRLKWAADTVLSVDSFAARAHAVPYEFAEFCGLLTVEKVQQVGAIASFRPPWSKFGLKRDSRKLHVEPLHLPPEESRAFGSAGADPPTAAKGAGDGLPLPLPLPPPPPSSSTASMSVALQYDAEPARAGAPPAGAAAAGGGSRFVEPPLAGGSDGGAGAGVGRGGLFARATAGGRMPVQMPRPVGIASMSAAPRGPPGKPPLDF